MRERMALSFVIISLTTILALSASTPAQEQQVAPAAQLRAQLFVAMYERGPAWDEAKTPFEQAGIRDHMQYLQGNAAKLIGAAPFQEALAPATSDRMVGMVIVSAATREEAEAFINADPAVTTSLMQATVRRWMVDRVKGY